DIRCTNTLTLHWDAAPACHHLTNRSKWCLSFTAWDHSPSCICLAWMGCVVQGTSVCGFLRLGWRKFSSNFLVVTSVALLRTIRRKRRSYEEENRIFAVTP